MNYESEISTLQAFSRVISLEEAVAYTTCSQAGLSKFFVVGRKVSKGSSRRHCQLGEGGRLGNIWGSKRGHTQVLNILRGSTLHPVQHIVRLDIFQKRIKQPQFLRQILHKKTRNARHLLICSKSEWFEMRLNNEKLLFFLHILLFISTFVQNLRE